MFSDLRFRLRSLFLRHRAESELDDELRLHYELQVEKYVQSGMTCEEAQRRTRLMFGGLDQVKEHCREARGISLAEIVAQDTRYGLRMLRKSPAFATTAILTLALGMGANIAIFSIVDTVLLKPLPYPHPEQLVSVELSPLALDPSVRGMAPEDYFTFREQSHAFQDIGIYLETDSDRDVNVTGFAEPERVRAMQVTGTVLSLLGTSAAKGRVFAPSDDVPGAPATAVLTYAYWQRKFSGDPHAIGKVIVVDGKAREIIGVLPRSFRFLDEQDVALFLPLQLNRNQVRLGNFSYFGIARLKPGTTLEQAGADVARMLPITYGAFPPAPGLSLDLFEKARLSPSLRLLKEDIVGNVGQLLWIVMGGIGIVLLIACANIANLLLVRTAGRQPELALREALGANRRRIAFQLLHESAILGLLGAVLGLGVAWIALRFLIRLVPAGLPRAGDVALDPAVLLFTFFVALLTSLLFGLIPVFKHAGVLSGAGNTRTVSTSREGYRAQNILVTGQVGLALVLLMCSGLMIRTFRAMTRVDSGFSAPAHLQTFRLSIPAFEQADDLNVTRMEQQIQNKLAEIPSVSSVAFASAVPMDGDNRLDNVYAADRVYEHNSVPPIRHIVYISPGYLQTLGISLVAGRDFDWAQTYNRVPVALVSENFAREYWRSPNEAIGKRVRISSVDDWREIVGVVADVHDQGLDRPARSTLYCPVVMTNFQSSPLRVARFVTFLIRTPQAGSKDLIPKMRQAVWSIDANLPLARIRTMSCFYQQSLARTSFTLLILAIAGGMALILGAIGLYGVIAYSVAQRTREIGVRMALGARRSNILSLVLGQAVSIILFGLAGGLVAALALTRLLSSLLFGVRAGDPLTYATGIFVLSLVALVACYIPALRATKVEPMLALRCE